MLDFLGSVFPIIKLILTSWIVVRILKALHIAYLSLMMHFVRPARDISELKSKWTVVTGCTDGIGRAYIEELAETRGIRKFYLVARNETKLSMVKKNLEERYGAEVRTVLFDFAKDSLDKLPSELKTLDVGILINCVGTGPTAISNLTGLPEGQASQIIRVNLMSTIKMIELILPGMVERDKGIIVNIASMTCWRPLPYMSSYPASKVALSFFTSALVDEYKHTNVRIQCLVPLLIATKIAAYSPNETSLFVTSPKHYVRDAVRLIGNCDLATGCLWHDIQVIILSLIGYNLFKAFFVPLCILGIHKKRLNAYAEKLKLQDEQQ